MDKPVTTYINPQVDCSSHSDYIIYVDESGDHSLTTIDESYPIFVLSFCIFLKKNYTQIVAPAVRQLKFDTFGHDMVVLHEAAIHHKRGAFSSLSKESREAFLEKLTDIIDTADFKLMAMVIDKIKHKNQYTKPEHPYYLAMKFGLERIYRKLKLEGKLTYIVCESRGTKEDRELVSEFRRICNGENYLKHFLPFGLIIADKKVNSEGLQLADLTARPIGLTVLRPDQENQTKEVLEKKYWRDEKGNIMGVGLKVFPK